MTESAATRQKQRLTQIYIYIMIAVFPLFTGFSGYSNITASKLIFYLALTMVWLVSLLTVSIRFRDFGGKRLEVSALCLLVYFALCCVSALFSPYGTAVLLGEGRFDGLVFIGLNVCTFLFVSRYGRLERGLVYALATSMSVICIVSILQLLGSNPLSLFPNNLGYYDMGTRYSGEFLGTIGNGNLYSAFLALCLMVFCSVFICGEKWRFELIPAVLLGVFCLFRCTVSAGKLAFFVAMLIFAPILFTNTLRLLRGLVIAALLAIALGFAFSFHANGSARNLTINLNFNVLFVALVASAVLLGLVLLLRRAEISRRTILAICLTLISLISGIGLVYIYNYTGTEGTIFEFSRVLHGELQPEFGSSRIKIWQGCFELAGQKPVLGGGPGTLPLRLDISFSRFVQETGRTLSTRVDNAHNVYLGILTDTGVLSLFAYLAAISTSLFSALRQRKKQTLALCLAAGLFAYWVQDFFGLGLFIVSPLMWIFWGLVSGTTQKGSIAKESSLP